MAAIVITKTWAVSEPIVNSDLNSDFSVIYNDYNGGITDYNVSATANIQASKILNTAATLTGVAAQAMSQPIAFSLPRLTVVSNSETVASATNMAVTSTTLVKKVTGTTTIVTITGGIEGQRITLLLATNLTITHGVLDAVNTIHLKLLANLVTGAACVAANPRTVDLLCTKMDGQFTNLQWIECCT